ncbi:hypothetical protein CIK76_18835 [Glutamicibacter sp. BW80]|uniref:hypothetical protein n=1 Tax=Glutamicibacter sp. BW80 TaxID=2024404 RepID=UPI000BB7566C|nr:hypothetical protein [Glutamicibacter sp. BW80]PCC27051.1 hypothetical protein CIK76_18835 [Glutamicibacter sp. BW80]
MNSKNIQVEVFQEAAAALKSQRYWDHSSVDDQIEFLNALSDVAREVAYQMDKYNVLQPEAVKAFRDAATEPLGPSFQKDTAELLLMGSLDNSVQKLYKDIREEPNETDK